jgi:ferredoxin
MCQNFWHFFNDKNFKQMKYKTLKRIRVVISLIFLTVLGLFFLDFADAFPPKFIRGAVFLQFIPSVLKFFNVFSWIAAGFIVILILTLLFGRVYCSTICPLGILQDVISYVKLKIFRKKKRYRYRYLKSYRWLRYPILIIATGFLLSGSIIIFSLLDPYSVFGRIISDLFSPLLTQGNNLIAGILNQYDIYALYHIDPYPPHAGIMSVSIGFLLLVTWLSLTKGRLYCNTVCPVGTFLGLVSKVALYKIRLNPHTCTKCGLCEKACKGGCIETQSQQVDFSRCVGCFNCLQVCPFSSAEYSLNPIYFSSKTKVNQESEDVVTADAYAAPREKSSKVNVDNSKRNFLAGLAMAFLGLSRVSRAQELVSYNATTPVKRENPISPPGAGSTKDFNKSCTACHLCVNVCPTGVLQPSILEYGLQGLMQPRMDNHAGFCNYDCTVCTEVCPTGALLPLQLKDKQITQLGKSYFVKENCIVETEGTDCGSCSEHCPTKAVYMVDYKNGLKIPEVNNDICVGCGACEYACPTHPYKAIYVDGNPVHVQVKKQQQEKVKVEEQEEDFPF